MNIFDYPELSTCVYHKPQNSKQKSNIRKYLQHLWQKDNTDNLFDL